MSIPGENLTRQAATFRPTAAALPISWHWSVNRSMDAASTTGCGADLIEPNRVKPTEAGQASDGCAHSPPRSVMGDNLSRSPAGELYRAGRDLAIQHRRLDVRSGQAAAPHGQPFQINDPRDTAYSNEDSFASDSVLTMFTQQWVGIRQACGALSGHKLALDGHYAFGTTDIGRIAARMRDLKIERVVYHGMAPSVPAVLRGLKRLLPGVAFYGVWHGTMAGWSSDEEVALFREFLSLTDDGIYDRIGFLRQGMDRLHSRAFHSILYNIPPRVDLKRDRLPFSSRPIKCIFPSWNNSWKNMYTNLLAAHCAPIVGDVFVYSKPRLEVFDKVRLVPFGNHDAHFKRVSRMDVCLNVSVNDCQPMAELEGLSVGTPSLRNDWNLDLQGNSPYEDAFTVTSYLNAEAIATKLQHISELDSIEIASMTANHSAMLVAMSKQRYSAFFGESRYK